MFVNSDFTDLLKLFNDNEVRYLVIGGYAFIQYTEPRFTKDLDLWISTDTNNAKAVFNALKKFGAPLTNLTEILLKLIFLKKDIFTKWEFHRYEWMY
jgi:hypothetical protein